MDFYSKVDDSGSYLPLAAGLLLLKALQDEITYQLAVNEF